MHLSLQELQDEHQRVLRECKDFLALRQGNQNLIYQDQGMLNQQKLLIRIEELEDLIVEIKQQ